MTPKPMLVLSSDVSMTESELQALNIAASKHRALLTASKTCGCFICLSMFGPDDIRKWIQWNQTALCPRCGEAAVIGDASWPELNRKTLEAMHKRWFEN